MELPGLKKPNTKLPPAEVMVWLEMSGLCGVMQVEKVRRDNDKMSISVHNAPVIGPRSSCFK